MEPPVIAEVLHTMIFLDRRVDAS